MTPEAARSIGRTAAVTAVATTAVTALCGAIDNRNPAAPVNAISHIAWGEEAASQEAVSIKYTLTGVALNAAAMVSWAAVHHLVWRPRERRPNAMGALARGAATAGMAYVVDFHVVPGRLTPGFEKRLSRGSILAIYAALAVSLALGNRTAH